ncbi:MFS transporter [Aliivibrio kagoshimensis]|uniref:MFS transporter n=1 Tax=Aliivibrio kagoshimensis TaxID=2910230 RepID=UPI003D0C0240
MKQYLPAYIELFTKMTSAIFTLMLGKLLFDHTGSLWAFATAFGSEFLIVSGMQYYASRASDTFSPIKILLLCNFFSIAIFTLFVFTYEYEPTVTLLLGALTIFVSRPFYRSALYVFVRNSVDKKDLARVNSRISAGSQLGHIIGLSFTGFVLATYSVIYLFELITVIFILCFILIKWADLDSDLQSEKAYSNTNLNTSWREFFTYCNHHKAFTTRLMSSFSIAISLGAFYVLLTPTVSAKFGGDSSWQSILGTSYALGVIAGGVMGKFYQKQVQRICSDNMMYVNQIIATAVFFCYGYFDSLGAMPALLLCFGVSSSLSAIRLSTFLQYSVTEDIAGRTSAVQNVMLALGNVVIAYFIAYMHDISFQYAAIGVSCFSALMLFINFLLYRRYPMPDRFIDS